MQHDASMLLAHKNNSRPAGFSLVKTNKIQISQQCFRFIESKILRFRFQLLNQLFFVPYYPLSFLYYTQVISKVQLNLVA